MQVAQKQSASGDSADLAGTASGKRGLATNAAAPWLLVAALTSVGLVLRLIVAGQPLFADELATYWIVTEHRFGGLLSTVHSDAEITPPLYFALSWLTSHVSHGPEYVRAPSLAAGVATIPLVYLVGVRTVGRAAALVAAALTALAPFMVYYSAEARAYALLMALLLLSTLALLIAVESGRQRWWVLYAAACCAALYTHYTGVFVLGAQFLWLLWAYPEARKAATVATIGAAVAFLPWLTGLRNDLTSPTTDILSALSPFTARDVWMALQHWSVGYPFGGVAGVPPSRLPGTVPLVALAISIAIAIAALVKRLLSEPAGERRNRFFGSKGVVLVVALGLAAPVGEAVASAVGSDILATRNLASSWPPLALAVAALLVSAGPRLRVVTAGLAIACFAVGAAKMLQEENQRPDYKAATNFVERNASPGDVVVDATGVSTPGPLTALDATFSGAWPVIRAGIPAQRDHPFSILDQAVTSEEAFKGAAVAANGGSIFVVGTSFPEVAAFAERQRALKDAGRRAGYRAVETRRFGGFVPAYVQIFERPEAPEG